MRDATRAVRGCAGRDQARGRARAPREADRGAVTAEFAVMVPSVVLLLALVLGLTSASVARASCSDAARAVARMLVVERSAPIGAGLLEATARDIAGPTASVAVEESGDFVRVTVTAAVGRGPGQLLPARVSATALGRLSDAQEGSR